MREEQRKQARVLVVDDEPQNVRYVVDVLTWAGYENLEGLTDPIEAVSRFADFQPDLVILDLLMPGMDGFDAMDAMREQLPEDEYLPFLILTSDISSDSRRRALSSGAKDFLTKPMSPTEVRLRVENLLETRLLYLELRDRTDSSTNTRAVEGAATAAPSDDHVELLERWAASLEVGLPDADGRSKRVAWLSGQIAQTLELSEEQIGGIADAALLHLLARQPTPVMSGVRDPSEWAASGNGEAAARALAGSSIPVLETARKMLSGLDEHWDGSGQPAGLRGEAIPIEARVVAVARYWDETQGSAAGADIERLAGTRFDPDVVAALLRTPAASG